MAHPHERLFELARDALAEQERQVEDLRRRVPPVLAAAAVVATLLTRPVFEGANPSGALAWIALAAAAVGVVLLLLATALLFVSRSVAFSVDAERAYVELWKIDATTEPESDIALAEALAERRRMNEPTLRGLHRMATLLIVGLILETGGLALAAALAS